MNKSSEKNRERESVSIIIPCYNTAKYIDECIRSVLCQSVLPDELIIVDDGSTDDTLEVLNAYKGMEGLTIISTPNRGLGAARNTGAKRATSEYILFLDSDDKISHDLINRFWEESLVTKELELFVFSFQAFDSKTGLLRDDKSHIYSREYQGSGPCVLENLLRENQFHSAAWSMILKRKCINWHSSGFKRILHEDEEFTPRIFLKSGHAKVTTFVGYYYRVSRPNSIMSTTSKAHWLRSRHGYFISFISCTILGLMNLENGSLSRALLRRSKYLGFHALVPFLSIFGRNLLRLFDRHI